MTNQILQKIRSEINEGIIKESQVVYVLAEIRKIMEQNGSSNQYPYLKFHCDWVLHSRLKGSFAQNILSQFNLAHLQLLNGEELSPNSEVDRISKMDQFATELSAFLSAHSIFDFTKSTDNWVKFIYLYGRVIEDSPLIIRDVNSKHIQEVVISVELAKEISSGNQFYKFSWNIKDSNGNSGTIFVLNSFRVVE